MAETLRIEIPIETIDETEPELSNVIKKITKLGGTAEKAGKSAEEAGKKVSAFDKSAEKTQNSLLKWAKEKYEILLEAKERITPVLAVIGNGIKGFAGRTWNVTMKAIDFVTAPVRGILNLLKNPIFQVGAVLGVSIGMADTINTYKDFEAAMSQVQAVSGSTSAELSKLTDKAKEMGATTKFTATESAEAFNYMAMAGWKTADMLDGIEGILSLAAASNEELATTSDIVTDALTAFKMKASESGHFADVLAAATSNANTTVSGMGETFKYAGTMAGTLGYSIEDVALATGLMANSAIKGTMAGTALNSIFTRLSTNTGGARDALQELGIEFFNANGSARDLSDVMDELREATATYSDKQKSSLANTIAGTEAQKGLLAILNASTEDYNKLADAVNNADGAAQNMSETMLDNLQGSLTLLQSAVDGVKISLGQRISPYVRSAAEWLTDMMPEIEAGLDQLMDFVERKTDSMKRKLDEIRGTREWQNADFFGKVKIAWREIIAEPFSEWWSSEGKQMLSDAAGNIGNAIGSGISAGVMLLLGIDVSDSINEGASVGKAFASGFAEGFDFEQISGKLWDGLKNMLSNAGKLLPGGESADLSSVISAAVLAKAGAPLFKLGTGAFKLGKGFVDSGGISMIGSALGSAGAGTGILGFGANTAINLGAGNLAGGASLGTGALAGIGLGATAGAVAAGATLISGGMDLYKSIKSEDKDEAAMYGKSGGAKITGVAAGAAAGAAIGSIIPGLGTAVGGLIGAGIGGIAGWVKGNKIKEEYEENLQAAQEAAEKAQKVLEATGFSVNDVTFETTALNDAINDTEVSAAQLGQMFQEAVSDKLNSRFGDLHLSLTEIKDVASKIVFDKQAEGMNKFAESLQKSEDSLSEFQSRVRELDKLNWKASLGMELSSDDIESYKKSMDELAAQAKTYLENKHYEASVALELLVGDENAAGMSNGLNSMYEGLEAQIDEASRELSDKMKIYLEDGIIELDEQKEITRLQQQIVDVTNKLSQAQEDAKFESLKIKYSGGTLDAESFASLQDELAANVQNMNESYDNALEVSLTNLKLQLSEGAIDQGQYDEMLAQIKEGYNARIDGLQLRVESFQLDTIAETFDSELADILPELEGTLSEKLKTAMDNALSVEPDPATWTAEDIAGWFGLGGLSGETQMAVAELLQKTAETIPQSMTETADNIGKAIEMADMTSIFHGIETIYSNTGTQIDETFSEPFQTSADVNVDLNWKITNPSADISVNGGKGSQMTASIGAYSGYANGGGSTHVPNSGRNTLQSLGMTAYAGGGFASGKQLSWLAEEGYGEFIIPTNPSRRTRALELYEQAGKALGVASHANGGFVGGSYAGFSDGNSDDMDPANGFVKNIPTGDGEISSGNSPVIKVSVQMSPEFQITSGEQNEDAIVQVIRRHLGELADELGGEIASRLEAVFSNMPRKGA
ncbi:phage tail tape measure protein [Candidatus Merdisoma sp. JLR.KK006]|uniref:phage tail tape measure protein n=1 Tax=Candidatus Merdisoma sp. JLR.KK006 TaxID=3112626 RepID=UPI002FF2724E